MTEPEEIEANCDRYSPCVVILSTRLMKCVHVCMYMYNVHHRCKNVVAKEKRITLSHLPRMLIIHVWRDATDVQVEVKHLISCKLAETLYKIITLPGNCSECGLTTSLVQTCWNSCSPYATKK